MKLRKVNCKTVRCLAALTVLAVSLSATALGQVVSFDFSGTIQSIDDPGTLLPADITVGQAYSGRITYDVAHVTDSQADPSNGVYDFIGAAQNDFSLNVIIGVHTITSQPTPNGFGNYIQVSLGGTHYLDYAARSPQLDGAKPPGNINDYSAILSLSESQGTLTSDALLTSAPVLSGFPSALFSFSASNGIDNYTVYTDVQTLTPVPEPASAALAVGFGLAGLAFWRRRRSLRHGCWKGLSKSSSAF